MAQGLLIPAAEEHYKAAEAFETAYHASTEENVRYTMLWSRVIQVLIATRSDETDVTHAL